MSYRRQNSNMLNDQKTGPNEQYEEVGHVTDSIDTGVSKPMAVCALRTLSSTSVATASTFGITSRNRLRNHHRSVRCNLRSHGLSGSGGVPHQSLE